jgi:hypothetical protein
LKRYQRGQKLSSNGICPAGRRCNAGSRLPDGPCSPGHFCPTGSSSATQMPCPAGTYFNYDLDNGYLQGASTEADCRECTIGHYCPEASVSPTLCPAGTYGAVVRLEANSDSVDARGCKACPEGWKCPSAGTIDPEVCGRGFYSGEGQSSCQECWAQSYCDYETTTEAELETQWCEDGYICERGITERPYHMSSFSCQPGYYCANNESPAARMSASTSSISPCPSGTWQPLFGAKDDTYCLTVPKGFYATSPGSTEYASNECGPGFYCPEGSSNFYQETCPASKFREITQGGAIEDCGTCPSGRYCPANTIKPFECPLGYYCPAELVIPIPCPLGTFGHSLGLRTVSECSICWGGRYCSQSGLAYPDGLCDRGYYCLEGAFTAAPIDGTTGNFCPAGGYCPTGSKYPINCPAGTYNPLEAKFEEEDCIDCPQGYYCVGSQNAEPTGECQAGYYCPTGSVFITQEPARAGFYTDAGQYEETQCEPGTYNPYPAQAQCATCDPGRLCLAYEMTEQVDCGAGYWCPAGALE